jgi:ACS family glucarate transporter-like MFS transporter
MFDLELYRSAVRSPSGDSLEWNSGILMIKKFPYRHRVLILLFFLIFITYLDRVCISLVGVRIKSAFHLSNEQFGWVLGAFALAYALFEIPSGMMADRIGQRAVFIRIVLWWSFFTALTGAVTGLTSLMLVRFLFGMGESGAYPTSSSTIARWFPATETGRSMSALFIGQNAGAAIAPLIVVPIAIYFGWRAPFFVNGLIGLIWVLVCWLWFRNEPSQMKGIPKEEIILIEEKRRFLQHKDPFPWSAVLSNWRIWAVLAGFFCSQWGLYFFVAWMPVYLQQGRHLSENQMKLVTSSLFVLAMGSALLSGILNDWLMKKKGLVFARRFVGMLGLGMSGLFLIVTASSTSNYIAVSSLLICGFFYSFYSITAFSTCVDIGGAKAGTMAGIMNFCGQIGAFFLSVVFGKIADAVHNYNTPVLLIAGILITGSIVWLGIDPANKIENLKSDYINNKGN